MDRSLNLYPRSRSNNWETDWEIKLTEIQPAHTPQSIKKVYLLYQWVWKMYTEQRNRSWANVFKD